MVAIQVYDRRIAELPDVGLMRIRDAETGHLQWVDTSSSAVRKAHSQWWRQQTERLSDVFTRSNVDYVSVRTDQNYVTALRSLFAQRT